MCIQSGLFHGGLAFPVSILNTSHPVAFPKNGAMARSRSGTFPPPDRSTTEIPGRQLPRQKGNLHLRSFILQWQDDRGAYWLGKGLCRFFPDTSKALFGLPKALVWSSVLATCCTHQSTVPPAHQQRERWHCRLMSH